MANRISTTKLVNVVTVNTPGPRGPQGPVGPVGPTGSAFPYTGSATISGSLAVTGSYYVTGSVSMNALIDLAHVSQSLDFPGDAAAAAGGVPLGGVYRSGNVLAIRIQ